MTRADTSMAGTLLDRRYRVDRLLARGGMSSVYRGVDTRLDRPVAIKIMDPRFADDRSFVERFEREARSAAKLHHPHVVAVHDQGFDTTPGDDGPRAFLVMELVDGGTLRDVLDERGQLDIPLALSVVEPVLSALATAHRAGLVHRDVKPENVLIGRTGAAGTGVVKVADFGLVRAVASAGTTSSSIILGTVAYLSPEQVTVGAASVRGDVYSTGILLYEMLTGRTPYTGDTAISVAYRHVNDDVPPPNLLRPEIPPALNDLVVRATRRDPEARPADAGAFLDELQAVRSALGIRPVPVPVPPAPDEARETDAEKTMPAFAAVTNAVQQGTGPRSTRMFDRPPPAQPPPPEPAAPAPSPGRRRLIAIWAAAVLLAGAALGTGAWLIASAGSIEVPKVAGMDRTAAEKVLRDAKLVPAVELKRHNTTQAGMALDTRPGAGSEAEEGQQIVLLVSAGRPVVPDVVAGTTVEQAEAAIRAAELQPKRDDAAAEFNDSVPEGAVIRFEPRSGSQANLGDPVTLVLSKGARPVPVPNVVGRSKDEAFATLRSAGFEPVEAGTVFDPNVPAGAVVRTDPGADQTMRGSKRVSVYLSNAVEVPSVVGRRPGEAKRILEQAGLKAEFENGRGNGNGNGNGNGDDEDEEWFNLVTGQDPQPGSRVEKGSKVRLRTVL
ncbi:Stk1 family PASTA domain-containing Ser/Thr kinase [Amycolatopsis suaedae]|uniref:non-specific serine/threonine protein kinase n=1 Tax=Amycolatopsis suaedae TaxID=2510978 RepID=A0A4Q7IYE3_9PSEU|nr:PASTA domain-containing protein [Amycolatopsis suaedae]RZQ59990.1 PASTA domain-containing protein [Amycolatopsis suaedae]